MGAEIHHSAYGWNLIRAREKATKDSAKHFDANNKKFCFCPSAQKQKPRQWAGPMLKNL